MLRSHSLRSCATSPQHSATTACPRLRHRHRSIRRFHWLVSRARNRHAHTALTRRLLVVFRLLAAGCGLREPPHHRCAVGSVIFNAECCRMLTCWRQARAIRGASRCAPCVPLILAARSSSGQRPGQRPKITAGIGVAVNLCHCLSNLGGNCAKRRQPRNAALLQRPHFRFVQRFNKACLEVILGVLRGPLGKSTLNHQPSISSSEGSCSRANKVRLEKLTWDLEHHIHVYGALEFLSCAAHPHREFPNLFFPPMIEESLAPEH